MIRLKLILLILVSVRSILEGTPGRSPCQQVDILDYVDDSEEKMYQMPLSGENCKRDNTLVYNVLESSACIKTDAWTWIQDHDLNKRLERANGVINCLHYKDGKAFLFVIFVTH